MNPDDVHDAMSSTESDADNARLRGEIARLMADNDDLRASAFYWQRLYEGALRRLNERADSSASDIAASD